MTPDDLTPNVNDLADLQIPEAELRVLLRSLGIHLDTPLAQGHLLAAADTLMAIELAAAANTPSQIKPALQLLATWRDAQAEPLRLTQQAVLQAAPADSISSQARNYLLDELTRLPVLPAAEDIEP